MHSQVCMGPSHHCQSRGLKTISGLKAFCSEVSQLTDETDNALASSRLCMVFRSCGFNSCWACPPLKRVQSPLQLYILDSYKSCTVPVIVSQTVQLLFWHKSQWSATKSTPDVEALPGAIYTHVLWECMCNTGEGNEVSIRLCDSYQGSWC